MSSPRDDLAEIGDAFGRSRDPLAKYTGTFEQIDVDVFELYIRDSLMAQDPAKRTVDTYRRTFEQYTEFMEEIGRHPACPSEDHVREFVKYSREERGQANRTIKQRLGKLVRAYRYWQQEQVFPHDPSEFNPFERVKKKTDLSTPEKKSPPRLPEEELREHVKRIKHVLDRAFVVTNLKLGMRATPVTNIRLEDVNIVHSELREDYPELGTHPMVEDRPNAIWIPPSSEREGNKSKVGRVMPLDEDMRRVLLQYLLIRPQSEESWLFLTKHGSGKCRRREVNQAWKKGFQEYTEDTPEYRKITSHYGRHRHSTWWKIEKDLNRELVKYMRGDVTAEARRRDSLDHYLHTYYEDIEDVYRENIYKLRL